MFDYLNLAAVRSLSSLLARATTDESLNVQIIDGSILCVHGGLSPEVRTIDQIRVIARAQEIPHEGAFCGQFSVSELGCSRELTAGARFDVVGS